MGSSMKERMGNRCRKALLNHFPISLHHFQETIVCKKLEACGQVLFKEGYFGPKAKLVWNGGERTPSSQTIAQICWHSPENPHFPAT
jgi:hypothetical protein